MSYNVLDVAQKLLYKASTMDDGDLMSNLKLQKMLYYEQGYHLAAFGTPLFDDDIQAWTYGPVVESVYNHFKQYGRNGIEPDGQEPIVLDKKEEETLFNEVFQAYAVFSAYGLIRKTHEETPWQTTNLKDVITHEKMKTYFKTLLDNGQD